MDRIAAWRNSCGDLFDRKIQSHLLMKQKTPGEGDRSALFIMRGEHGYLSLRDIFLVNLNKDVMFL